jgi:hypothetical protein
MKWVCGLRSDILYSITKRPLDPRWSQNDLHILLGHCANAQSIGWNDTRAFNTAEAIIIKTKNYGIYWSNENLNKDINELLSIAREEH